VEYKFSKCVLSDFVYLIDQDIHLLQIKVKLSLCLMKYHIMKMYPLLN